MNEALYALDVATLRGINHGWSGPWMDVFFKTVTDWGNFYIIIFPWLALLCWKGGVKGRWAVAGLLLSIALADQFSSHLLKDLVARVRPCNALVDVITPLGKRKSFSFPSSHGVTMGAAALFLSLSYRRWTASWIMLALLVGLSRIYLGLHYPSDVLSGLIIGSVVGYGVWWAIEKARTRIHGTAPETAAPQIDGA